MWDYLYEKFDISGVVMIHVGDFSKESFGSLIWSLANLFLAIFVILSTSMKPMLCYAQGN